MSQCRHCQRERKSIKRGLCWKCWYTPGVRELYPSTSKHAKRGVGVGGANSYAMPASPTSALPGTPEKVEELCKRALMGTAIFHPEDAQIGD